MERCWSYFKCKNCGRDGLGKFVSNYFMCTKCGEKIYYDEQLERDWLNETDENGERIRLDFSGFSEDACREKAAAHFGCEKEDITNYYIVQIAGLFKKCIICATKPAEYEIDENATRILMWEYENRPSIWADINLENKTILYPRELGDKKQSFEKIIGIKKCKDDGTVKNFALILEPQGEIAFPFYPGYTNDIDTLIQIAYKYSEPIKHGIFVEKVSCRHPFDIDPAVYLEISSADFNLSGRMRYWKKDDKICLLNTDSCQGIDISIDDIKYFRSIGQKYVTTEITGGGGGGSSIKGAVIGGLIAGDVGAIVGSRKAVNEVKGTSTIHDEQVVLLYSNDLEQVITFSSNAYKIFTKLIPEKDYEVVVQANADNVSPNKTNDNDIELLDKLANLYEKGILTQEEFEKKKQEVLKRL